MTPITAEAQAPNRVADAVTPRVAQPRVRGYASGKADYLVRLRKIEGQVRGLQRMIESDTWCPDVVVQIASATRALQEVAVGLVNDHLHHCVMAAAKGSDDNGQAALEEVAAVIRQVVRL
jgi:DNA-binding FrmR family transcriptional regulator